MAAAATTRRRRMTTKKERAPAAVLLSRHRNDAHRSTGASGLRNGVLRIPLSVSSGLSGAPAPAVRFRILSMAATALSLPVAATARVQRNHQDTEALVSTLLATRDRLQNELSTKAKEYAWYMEQMDKNKKLHDKHMGGVEADRDEARQKLAQAREQLGEATKDRDEARQ
jgi:hypothetical protein